MKTSRYTLKPPFTGFRLMTMADQKQHFARLMKRARDRSAKVIANQFERQLELAKEKTKRAHGCTDRIDRAEDRVADAADKMYGETEWRRTAALMKIVASTMLNASAKHRMKRDRLLAEAAALRKPYETAMRELNEAHEAALATSY